MIGTLVPEFVIHRTLSTIVGLLRRDLIEHKEDEQNTILYRLLAYDEGGHPLQINLYNVFRQAQKIFSTPQNLTVNFGYNQEVAQIISLHILLPGETGSMAIGADEGYLKETLVDDAGNPTARQGYYTQTYDATYQVMITSANSAEVTVVYTVLKSMLLALVPQMELMGLRTPTLSGNDIVMQDDLTPVPLYHKVLNLHFLYEHNVPRLVTDAVAKRFLVEWRMVPPTDEDFH